MGQFCEIIGIIMCQQKIKKLSHRKVIAVLRKNTTFGGLKNSKTGPSTSGGSVLHFDKAEIEVLRLCAWCKNLPVNRCRNIPAEILDSLVKFKLIRLSRNQLAYRCTPAGFGVLQGAEMPYLMDKDYRSSGGKLERRLQSAEITSFFWRYGADVFAESPAAENECNIFLPSFALRRQQHADILGGNKLLGFYYAEGTVFIPYFIAEENGGVFPEIEQRAFRTELFLQGRNPHIIYTGYGELDKLIQTVSYKKERSERATSSYYKDAMEQFNCPVAIVPMDEDGMRQLRILSVPDYRQRLMKNLLGEDYLPPTSPKFDGRTKSENFIIGFDCNILRFENAVKSKKPTSIFVLPSQEDYVAKLVDGTNAKCFVIKFEDAERYFGLPHELPAIDRTTFQTGKGGYVDVPLLGKTKKAGR